MASKSTRRKFFQAAGATAAAAGLLHPAVSARGRRAGSSNLLSNPPP